jgi:beta-glucanase (GH16 family)
VLAPSCSSNGPSTAGADRSVGETDAGPDRLADVGPLEGGSGSGGDAGSKDAGESPDGVALGMDAGDAGAVFFDDFSGTSLGSAWAVVERRGPPSQDENECNTPGAVVVSGDLLTITTSATPAACGDAITAPTQLPYTSGDVQWKSLTFTYGTVQVRAKFPPENTGTWPAIWLLGANCQAANMINGSEAVAFDGCPAQGDPSYQEIDMVECDPRGWCHLVVAQGSNGWSNLCSYPVDGNWHLFTLTWNESSVSMAVDGQSTACSFPNTSLHGPMFLIMQTQTTTSAGVAGLPTNANLPTTFQIDYVKVTQP